MEREREREKTRYRETDRQTHKQIELTLMLIFFLMQSNCLPSLDSLKYSVFTCNAVTEKKSNQMGFIVRR